MPKYDPDDVIRLAEANPGFGFRQFIRELYGKKRTAGGSRTESRLLRLFDIHKFETGVDLFELLQSTEFSTTVTEAEYLRRTGRKYLPKGSGRGTGSRVSRAQGGGYHNFIDLPPQEFNWLDVSEIPESEYVSGSGSTNHIELMDYELLMRLHDEEMMTISQISHSMGVREARIEKFLSKLEEYDEEGIVNEWLAVMKRLWEIQCHRGSTHKEDELMMDFRGIFRDYVKDPINVERPTIADINWVYKQLIEEEKQEREYSPEVDLVMEKRQTLEELARQKKDEYDEMIESERAKMEEARLAGYSSIEEFEKYTRSVELERWRAETAANAEKKQQEKLAQRWGKKRCRKCEVILDSDNSYKSFILNSQYICKKC